MALMGIDIGTTGSKCTIFDCEMATIIIAMLPILCVYPFVQKYFVKGVIVGSVKE